MERLIAFGCSHTYGMSLEDNFTKDKFSAGYKSSKHAWPEILADKLNLECVNNGICAASNLEILISILRQQYHCNDTVFVLWTTPYRDMLKFENYDLKIGSFLIDKTFSSKDLNKTVIPDLISNKINPNEVINITKKYFSTHEFVDMEFRSYLYQFTAALFLQSKNLQFKFASAWNWPLDTTDVPNFISKINILNDIKKIDYALDKKHFGPKTHKEIAKIFYKLLDNE